MRRLLQQILLHQGASAIQVQQALLLWLANPFVFAVSARGSADSMTAALQLLVLWWLLNGEHQSILQRMHGVPWLAEHIAVVKQ